MKTSRTITCGIMTCMWILALFAASVSAGSLERQRRQLGPDCQLMNWQAHGGNEYGYFDHTKSFTAAEGICMRCQATIASISSAEEMTFVRALVPGGHAFWLGASDRGTEGTFVWLDGSSMSYTNWRKGEPDNQSTDEANEADCAYVNNHGLWRDNHCDLNSKRFVCKRAATAIVTTVSPPPTTAPTTMMTRPMLTQTMGTSPMMMTTQTMPPVTTVAPVSIADAAPSVDPRVQSMPVFITGRPQQEVSQIRHAQVSHKDAEPLVTPALADKDAVHKAPCVPKQRHHGKDVEKHAKEIGS
ncbi:C-type lectin domain family 4 member F-like isoform X2 [Littorina saxatilis]|uniref:C-type lectin domain family 4 member F-like isoform X2 n=1 Tax=Littorina saxatilis TaxID=31220 RepID=UPI0038B49887